MRISPWAWFALVVSFLLMEGIALFNKIPDDTATQTTLHHVPAALIVAFLAWLCVHFGSRIYRNRHGKQDGL